MKFNTFVSDAIDNKFENREQFAGDMARIAGMIDYIEKTK